MTAATPLWSPSPEQIRDSHMSALIQQINHTHGTQIRGYDQLWQWSVDNIALFWKAVWDDTTPLHSTTPDATLGRTTMPLADWFPGARLNFAENLLRYRDEQPALVFHHESGAVQRLSYRELFDQVAKLAHSLQHMGVGVGDRVAGFMPNRIETVVAMLATTSLGAIWSSCSPDFGFRGVMDRFGQIEPKVLFACDGYTYGGKRFDRTERLDNILREIPSIERLIVVPALGDTNALTLRDSMSFEQAITNDACDVEFAQLPFDHPLYIMYSSGTTGVPKCIVHGAGGTLMQHLKELRYHNDLRRESVIFYFTTCGWMMWNWLVSSLALGATVVLYDGSPGHPSPDHLWQMAEDHGVTHFGTSPKFLDVCRKAGLQPGSDHNLSALRAVLSTGSPLSDELFHWVYEAIKADVQLASICGGTDIISCFMLGSPISPVYAGEIQKRGLGMRVEAWAGPNNPVVGEKAELVCTAPFVSMPVGFWRDDNHSKYRKAYFSEFDGIWHHGDFVEITEQGGVVVFGRSDATLNPGGVRIGTAEIYRVVESHPGVVDSMVIGQRWQDDVRVVLFVVLEDGLQLTEERITAIRTAIRRETTPRHMPAKVLQVPAIPRTISGKKVEIAVSRVVHGEAIANRDAMANPEALAAFTNRPELQY